MDIRELSLEHSKVAMGVPWDEIRESAMAYHETAALEQSASGRRGSSELDEHNELRQWTIKNLESSVVEKARAAAKKNGMKINAWVAATLSSAADEQLKNRSNHGGYLSEDLQTIVSKIELARNEHRLMIERIEKDISQLVKGQHGMLVEIMTKRESTPE